MQRMNSLSAALGLLIAAWLGNVVPLSAAETFAPANAASNPMPYPFLPEGITSFGAAVTKDHLYVFGGHMGRVPGNSLDGLSPHFCRLKLSDPSQGWESLPMQQSSQSPGLVAWNGSVYRVGGLSFKNKLGESTVFESLATFAKFDPETKAWKELPPLPEPRSSLDAAVVDGKLYVVGGWNLQGENSNSGVWHEDTLVFDLANESGTWTATAKTPFQARAIAAAEHNHKLYILGGMKSTNQTTSEVHVYDPATNAWSAGPALKTAGDFGGFAIAAFATGGKLYYSGGDGTIYGLDEAGDGWNSVERLCFSRMFHRVVPLDSQRLIAIGGITGTTYQSSLEVVDVGPPVTGKVKAVSWTVPFAGHARHSQSLFVQAGSLYAFGGNTSPQPHDFSKDAFSREAFKFDITTRTVEQLPNLPQPTQSGAAVLAGRRIDQSIYVLGGLSPTEDKFTSTDLIQQYRIRSKGWSEEQSNKLPGTRSMFQAVTYNNSIWIFGGAQSGTAGRNLVAETLSWSPVEEQPVRTVEGASIPTPRRSFAGAVLGDHFYAIGGLGAESQLVTKAEVYDIKDGKWTEIPAPQTPRVFPSLAASGGKLYLCGGFTKVDGHFAPAKSLEVYDPATKVWTYAFEELAPTLADLTVLSWQDRLLFYGIDKAQAGLATFVLVDPNPYTVGNSAISGPMQERGQADDLFVRLIRLDKNRDGKLTAEEIGGRFKPLVEQADENKDGIVTREELEAFTRREQAANRPAPAGR